MKKKILVLGIMGHVGYALSMFLSKKIIRYLGPIITQRIKNI